VTSTDLIAALRRYTSPTISNAIETFNVRPWAEGYTNSRIVCVFPELGPLVGYACTAVIRSAELPSQPRTVNRRRYWEYLRAAPLPKLSVLQDLSDPPGGAYWGELNANIHLTLGSQGVITNGTVRDLEEVRRAGFHLFASGVHVSHGYAHLEDFNVPVEVFGMRVHPGDLIHADRHGAVVIPAEIAARVPDAAADVERGEKAILEACESSDPIGALDRVVSPEY
jgi:4-hydroxy-4-methyl-2-oxoglutarate aldolase